MKTSQSPRWCLWSLNRQKWKLAVLVLLVLCTFICNIVFNKFTGNRSVTARSKVLKTPSGTSMEDPDISRIPWLDSYAFIHLNSGSRVMNVNASLVMIFPYSRNEQWKFSEELSENDKRALWKLSKFLGSMKKFDGATCILQHNREGIKHDKFNTARNNSLNSSWCSFLKRKWSVHIRNMGLEYNVKLRKTIKNPSSAASRFHTPDVIELQHCNILQGPFVIRKDVFHRIGGLLQGFGKVTLLEFFLRSEGKLKMAKLANCAWTPEISRSDRGIFEGSNKFPEYTSIGNKHQILRIVTERRIEWTSCVANWKVCPEKPYAKPRHLPNIAAPICRSVVLGQMLEDFKWAFNKLGLEYRIIFGTLLGAERSNAIIPWTSDVDIAISKAAFKNLSTFTALQQVLGSTYYVGKSFRNMPRAHMLMAPYIEIDTAPFFDGPHDLKGDSLFGAEIEEAVKGMLPISQDWRSRGYVDLDEKRVTYHYTTITTFPL